DISPGATLLELRVTPDTRTNSIVVSGSRTDIDTIAAIIAKLESIDTPNLLTTEVIKIKNASVADIYTTLNNMVNTFNTNYVSAPGGSTTSVGLYARIVTVFYPEYVTNQLVVGGSPQAIARVRELVAQLDIPPPQVYIQVLVAEVTLTNNNEFGIEVGLQS